MHKLASSISVIGFRIAKWRDGVLQALMAIIPLLFAAFFPATVDAQSPGAATREAPEAPIEGRIATARAKSSQLSPKDREAVMALFASAFQVYQANNHAAARIGFEDGLARDPANGIAQFYLAEILMRLGEQREAIARYDMAAALAPTAREGLLARAALERVKNPQVHGGQAAAAPALAPVPEPRQRLEAKAGTTTHAPRMQLGLPKEWSASPYGREAIGTLGVQALEAGTVVPSFMLLKAVGEGTLTGAWVPPSFAIGIDSAFDILGNAPFGLDGPAYVNWRFDPAAAAVANALYQAHNVKGILCGVQPEVGVLWTKKPLRAVADLRNLRLRATGGTIQGFVSLGANVNALPGGEIAPALERGLIEAAAGVQFIDDVRTLNLPRVTQWHAKPPLYPVRGVDLMVNVAYWNSLPPATQANVESQCRAIAMRMHTELSRAGNIVREEASRSGLKTYKLPDALTAALRKAMTIAAKPGETASATARMLLASQTGYSTPAVKSHPQ